MVRVLPGEPTRPDPPELPVEVKVYPEPPTPETARVHFELTGATVRPGTLQVPLDLFITSRLEFSGFLASVVFPPRYLELARVVERTRPGVVSIDNAAGGMGIFLYHSGRRIGAEGERVHIATLEFNIKAEAREVPEVRLGFEDHESFTNWVAIKHSGGTTAPGQLPLKAEVAPLLITGSVLKVRGEIETTRGDANLDYRLDISDPLAVFSHLFQGGPALECRQAADFNLDGRLDIADPIAMLGVLFLGTPAPAGDGPATVRC